MEAEDRARSPQPSESKSEAPVVNTARNAGPPAKRASAKPDTGFRYIPVLYESLVVIAIFTIPYAIWMMRSSDDWNLMVAYMVIVPCAGELIRMAGSVFGDALSKAIFASGMAGGTEHPLSSQTAKTKWRRQFWQVVVHGFFALMEAYVIFWLPESDEKWPNLWEKPMECWNPLPSQGVPYRPTILTHIYLAQLWVWSYTTVYHLFIDEKCKDYYESIIHHIVTVSLVAISASMNYHRIGLIILFVNDGVDVSVDLLRLTNFVRLRGAKAFFITEATLIFMAAHFFWWRIALSPDIILHNVMLGVSKQCGDAYPETWMGEAQCYVDTISTMDWSNNDSVHTFTMITGHGMLGLLSGLHCIWMFMIFRVIYKAIFMDTTEASKDYEGDAQEEAADKLAERVE